MEWVEMSVGGDLKVYRIVVVRPADVWLGDNDRKKWERRLSWRWWR